MTSLTMWLLLGMFVSVMCGSLRDLYDSRVVKAEWMIRPKRGYSSYKYYGTTHSGVRVTLEDGRRFLIHKGLGFGYAYGTTSDTVVTGASNLKRSWRETTKKPRYFWNRWKTVRDFVRAGGRWYLPLGGNCHDAADAMMRLKK